MTPEAFIEQAKLYSSLGELKLTHDIDTATIRLTLRAQINGYHAGATANITEVTLEHMSSLEADSFLRSLYIVYLVLCFTMMGWVRKELNETEVQTSIAEKTNDS